MDFHSLTRRELQALCKKNKIPANITNVAMVDALKALHKVEGLDEIIEAHKSDPHQSPEKPMPPSPATLPTAIRTSTRRTTRRTVAEEADQPNNNVSLLETPAIPASRRRAPATSARRKKIETIVMEGGEDEKHLGQEKSNLPETPITSRRRATVASSRGKDEISVQRVYSTRRSVRLLEKSMEELSLKEIEGIENQKCDGSFKEIKEVEENKDLSGDVLLTRSEENFKKTMDLEALSCPDLDLQLENEEIKHELQEDKYDDEKESCNTKLAVGSQQCNDFDDLSGLNAEDKETSDEMDTLQDENSEKKLNLNKESIDENGENVFIINDSETLNAALKAEVENNLESNEDSLVVEVSHGNAAFVMETEHAPVTERVEVSAEIMNAKFFEPDEINNLECIESVSNLLTPKVTEFLGGNSVTNVTEDEHHSDYDLQSKFEGNQSNEVQKIDNSETAQKKVSLEDVQKSDESSNGPESPKLSPQHEQCEEVAAESYAVTQVDVDVMETEHTPVTERLEVSAEIINAKFFESDEINNLESIESVSHLLTPKVTEFLGGNSGTNVTEDEQHSDYDLQSKFEGNQSNEAQKIDNSETAQKKVSFEDVQKSDESSNGPESPKLSPQHEQCEEVVAEQVDVDVIEVTEVYMVAQGYKVSSDLDRIPRSEKSESYVVSDCGLEGKIPLLSSETLINIPVKAAEEFGTSAYQPQTLDSLKHMNHHQPLFSGDKVPFAADTIQGQFPRPTESKPSKSSAIHKIIQASDINKENIIESGLKVDPEKDNVNVDTDLAGLSLRKLEKMLKEKLQIANMNNEETNITKMEKKRLALQTLPEN